MKSDKRLEILLCQYRECLSFIRTRTASIWQLPSMSMAINSFLAITYLGYATTFEVKIVILLASFFYTFISTIQLRKHRFLQKARNIDFRWIQTELCNMLPTNESVREIELRTKQIWDDEERYPTLSRTWWTRQGAYKWFLGSMYVTMSAILLLLLYEVIAFLTSIGMHVCL